jgi:acetyltransferase-like isoleucine patch superfamily enzyme
VLSVSKGRCLERLSSLAMDQRNNGKLIEPNVRVRGSLVHLDRRLRLEKGVHLDLGIVIWLEKEEGTILLGERVYVGPHAYLGTSSHMLEIGEDTMIGAHSYIITENHVTRSPDVPYMRQGFEGGDVIIGRNVWIGCHVVVLPGVRIGDNAVVGAGAVVTRDIPAGETWGGVPARKLKSK